MGSIEEGLARAPETFIVPAFEVTLERTEDEDIVLLDGVDYGVAELKRCAKEPYTIPALAHFYTAAIAYLDANKPDPKPGFSVHHEVDGEWKWTAVFDPDPGLESSNDDSMPWFLKERGASEGFYLERAEFTALCERDGVTL